MRGTDDGWSNGAERDLHASSVFVHDQAEPGDGYHHGFARSDLREASRPAKSVPARPDDQLIGCEGGLLWSGQEFVPGEGTLAVCPAAHNNLGVINGEHR